MKKLVALFTAEILILSSFVYGAARIQNSDIKSLAEVGNNPAKLIDAGKIYDSFYHQPLSTSISNGQLSGGGAPAGAIIAFAGTTAPTGFLLCNGSAVSRSTYSVLFAAIGTAFGTGDGTTTFNLPDTRGLFLRGLAGSSTNDPDASARTALNGGNAGNLVGSYQADQYLSHTHGIYFGGGGAESHGGAVFTGGPGSTSQDLASGGNETRPKNLYVNYLIKF